MKIVKLLQGDYRNLSHVNRYSGVPLQRPENVAEHTFYVVFFAWILALDLEQKGQKIDIKRVFEKATIHDFEEAMSGDIIRTFKYYKTSLKKQIDEVSESLFNKMLDEDFPTLKKSLVHAWSNCKDETIEGRIVAFADLLSVLAYTTEEIIKGNVYMIAIRNGATKLMQDKFGGIKEFQEYIKEIHEFLSPTSRSVGVVS